jgi:hypothetical protein
MVSGEISFFSEMGCTSFLTKMNIAKDIKIGRTTKKNDSTKTTIVFAVPPSKNKVIPEITRKHIEYKTVATISTIGSGFKIKTLQFLLSDSSILFFPKMVINEVPNI